MIFATIDMVILQRDESLRETGKRSFSIYKQIVLVFMSFTFDIAEFVS